jgi:serine protease Do
MYNNYDYNNYYNGFIQKPPKNRRKTFTYIAIVLVTSILSGALVGTAMYNRFSNELEEVKLTAQNAVAVSKMLAAENGIEESNKNGIDTSMTSNGLRSANNDSLQSTIHGSDADVTAIAKKSGPAIVGIRMTISGTRQSYYGSTNSQAAEGSGIVISEDGYIMTNYHVVSGADKKSGLSNRTVLEVFMPDGREAEAKYVGGDSETDLAVIKIELDDLVIAELGDSSKLEVGELAVAIGNPLGMEFAGSVTVGVISALNRTIVMEDKTMNLIQTDAAINNGNSGGALLNSKGEVIGINSVKIAASGVEGLGFAIPINEAKPIVQQLMIYGYVKGRPFIGISGEEISDILARFYNLTKGVYITHVSPGSGAERAGIRQGDILVSLDDKTVETMDDIDIIKDEYKPGDTVTAVVVRNKVKKSLKLTFDEAQ